MQLNHPLYKNIGIHVNCSVFTIDKGVVKVLLVKRSNEPFNGCWSLPGGCLYNNELVLDAAKRELKEKTGLTGVDLSMHRIFDDVYRSELKRMIAITFIGVIDIHKVDLLSKTQKTSECGWFDIREIPKLAYDNNEILDSAIDELKVKIQDSDILKSLFPHEFTLAELHSVYETILNIEIDRRNFRKKMINSGIVIDTNKTINYKGNKPAKLYVFNEKNKNKSIF